MEKSKLRSEIAGAIRNGCNVKLLGDSLTAGSGSSDSDLSGRVIYHPFRRQRGKRCWASLLSAHLCAKYGCSVDNVGCYGTTSDELMEHLDTLYQPITDRVVFCMIGANDKKQENGLARLESNLRTLCAKILSDGNLLVLMTPNPATAANDAKPNRIYTQAQVAEVIRRVAQEFEGQLLFIDHFADMMADCQRRGLTLEDYLEVGVGPENDGLHPGDQVYRFYFETICQALGV